MNCSRLLCAVLLFSLPTIAFASHKIDYSKTDNWATLENDRNKPIDIFYVAPTVGPKENKQNMSLDDAEKRARFLGTINMVRGVFENTGRIYAPYYRQAGLGAYYMSAEENKPCFDLAYRDVLKAFKYYMKHYNNDRPLIIGGFSQGAQHSIRLIKKYASDSKFRKQFVAGYTIGWRLTDDEIRHHKHLKPAQGETDTGVIIVYNTESQNVDETFIVPKNSKSHCINPLNWRTDSSAADRNLNLGACFTDFSGNILMELPEFTGASIDDKRGVLKLIDIQTDKYPKSYLPDGIYHRYDYSLFYRNIQQNVAKRAEAFLAEKHEN